MVIDNCIDLAGAYLRRRLKLLVLSPRKFPFPASLPLKWLLYLLYPLVWLINAVSNTFLCLFGVRVRARSLDGLSMEELRVIVNDAGNKISSDYQQMLLRIFDLERVSVEDVMVPRNEIHGIDLDNRITYWNS